MTRPSISSAMRLLSLVVAFVIAIGGFTMVKNLGWLSPFGINSRSHDSQVIHALERTQEVALVGLGIEGIKEEEQDGEIFGVDVWGTTQKVFMRYSFNAKLGIDGEKVKVTKKAEDSYLISVPEFTFIGYEDLNFEVAVEDGSVLSWTTPDIDKVEMVNEVLNDDEKDKYVISNEDILEAQTKVFYDSLIKSIDSTIVTEYEFSS